MGEAFFLNGLPMDGTEMLTPRETAAVLGVGPLRVRQLASSGDLPYSRGMGGHRRYLAADVITLREKRRKQGITR